MTLAIEACGIVILLLWTVIPVKEFSQILRTIQKRDAAGGASSEQTRE
jgi:hypothetical protein